MRLLMTMIGLMMAFAAAPAQAQWTEVEGGQRHDKSGLICPSNAGGFELRNQVATDRGFSCRYNFTCIGWKDCAGAVAEATVNWNPAGDFSETFRNATQGRAMTVINGAGPSWAGPPRLFANAPGRFAAWWQIQSRGQPLNIGVFYNANAAAGAKALVEAVVKANGP